MTACESGVLLYWFLRASGVVREGSSYFFQLEGIVCSLPDTLSIAHLLQHHHVQIRTINKVILGYVIYLGGCRIQTLTPLDSEERRVGQECRLECISRWLPYHHQ